uniref:Uncharacterized protein n=1 Tax=Panagrolaimus sp. ES5 TaxID=591445 RepID=A0AC34FP48_9BILA
MNDYFGFCQKYESSNKPLKAKNSSINHSTLSVHIANYENSIQEDSEGEEEEILKKNDIKLGKKWKTAKQVFDGLSAQDHNSFEFPRQQESVETKTPEVAQFKASQILLNPIKKTKTNLIESFVAGGVGGLCTVAVGHPFDTVKVRLQAMSNPLPGEKPLFTGALDCVKKTVVREGFLALYKGSSAPAICVTPIFAIYFLGCDFGRDAVRLFYRQDPVQKLTFCQTWCAGALAGFCTTIVAAPAERVKCLLQVQLTASSSAPLKYTGPVDVLQKLYKEGGFRSIYRGGLATISRDIPACGTFLSVYEFSKKKFAGENQEGALSPLATLCAGGVSGIARWSVCIPQDVIKSRLQTAPTGKYPNGIRDVVRDILQHEGPSGFFRGFVPVMLRAFPANAACFTGVEITRKAYNYFNT